jgi:hypothetical protein
MEIILRKDISAAQWDRHVSVLPDASFLYTSLAIEYYRLFSPFLLEDLSFVMLENKICRACVPLFLEEVNGEKIFANGGSFGVAPLVALNERYKITERLMDNSFEKIFEMAAHHGVKKIFMRLDPLVNPDASHKIYNYNLLMRHGFENKSLTTRIIDLRLSHTQLYEDLPRGTKAKIRQGTEIYSAEWYNAKNISEEIFSIYQNMHHRAAGRITRPLATFDLMHEWIKNANGFLQLIRFGDFYINAIIIFIHNGRAYYASGADNPDVDFPKPVGHLAHWSIINFLKNEGATHYEIGWQQFSAQPYDCPSQKDISISFFKSLFGGYNSPLFRGELILKEN